MTDSIRLKEILKNSGYKSRYVAEFVGISYQALLNKINNVTEFRVFEIVKLCELLKISDFDRDKIFFSTSVAKIDNN